MGMLVMGFGVSMCPHADFDRNVTFILTGSEVGLLYDLIGVEDPKSPLFGRFFYEIDVNRFTRDEAIDFLTRGFRETGIDVPRDVIEILVDMFNGIPGWLIYAANLYLRGIKDLTMVREAAVNEALNELNNFIRVKANYSTINARRTAIALKCIANGNDAWSKVAECVEDQEGASVSTASLGNIIASLEKLSIIKDYKYLDPVYNAFA
ncbi:AAA family ATPase [Caldivirga sp.]|uniref:AAA family ATPase n=1 Tax=Caldivirga sp. TaxID=2080243 RepID=UPI003D0A1A3A